MLGLRTFFAAVALFSALAADAKPGRLSAEAARLIYDVAAQIPGGELGARRSLRSFTDLANHSEGSCDHLLNAFDPEKSIPRASPLDERRRALLETIARKRLRGELPAVKDFHLYSAWHRARVLKEIMSNADEAESVAARGGFEVSLSRVIQELLAVPYDDVERELDAEKLAAHWSGPYAGPELDSAYGELRALLRMIGPLRGRFVDVGSGYGVPGVLLSLMNGPFEYVGLEIAPEKIRAARKVAKSFALANLEFRETDLSKPDFKLPDADYYYMFNPVHPALTDSLLKQLNEIAARKKIRVILNSSWGDVELLTNMELIGEAREGRRTLRVFSSKK